MKRIRLTPEDRKANILNTALALAELQGLNNFSSPELARACNCGHPLIFHHFDGMEALRREVMQKAVDEENLNVLAQGLVSKDPIACAAPERLRQKALKNI